MTEEEGLFLVDYIVILFQAFHEDVGDFIHFVLVLDGFQKFLAINGDHLEDDQLAAVLQSLLWVIIDGRKSHVTVFAVVDGIQDLQCMFYAIIVLQGEDVVAKFVVDHSGDAPFFPATIIL